MDEEEKLSFNLREFKEACQDKGYIIGQLYFDEAKVNGVPASFIVKMMVKKEWIDIMGGNRDRIIDVLIDVLWETTTFETRESVYLLSIFHEGETDLLKHHH
ncbi:MAG: hypothetical protein Q9M50_11455 [Methylococcales bacterium]|nr:hypothetical protein [Methylococcales bacterium]